MSTEIVAAPNDTSLPWVLTTKLPVVVMLSVVKVPCVSSVTVPALCKGASVNAEAVTTVTSAHEPPLASLKVSMPVRRLLALFKFATWLVPVSAVNVVVPFPAGGGTDIVGRVLGQKLSEALGQPLDAFDRDEGAGGRVRIAEEGQLGAGGLEGPDGLVGSVGRVLEVAGLERVHGTNTTDMQDPYGTTIPASMSGRSCAPPGAILQ